MKALTNYAVDITLEIITINVKAQNKREAKKKAIEKLNKMNPSNMIHRTWPEKKKDIYIEEV